MRHLLLASILALTACTSSSTAALDPAKAQQQAEKFTAEMYPGVAINGPICLPEEVIDHKTQCSFSFKQGEDFKAGSLICGNGGCREGSAPMVVAQDDRPGFGSGTTGNNDWLMWYLLFSNGGTTHHYHSWYDSTPAAYRGAYYSRGYRPPAQATSYYRSNYSKGVTSTTRSRYTPAPTTSRPSTTAPRPTTTSPASAPRPVSRPAPSTTRSSGYGTSRSRGFSGGSRRK